MLATMSLVKVSTFYYWQQHWLDIINYVTKIDLAERQTNDKRKMELINNFTKYCRKITYSYWFLVYTTVSFVICYPLAKYLFSSTYRQNVNNGTEPYFEIVRSWVPFDKSTAKGYFVASIYQAFSAIVGGGWITTCDSNAIVLMVFFRADLELLRIDCTNIFGTKHAQVSDDIAIQRLKECKRRHVELMKYYHLFDYCLSPIMFCYMIVCSIMLCVTAYQITSLDLSSAPFESIWWERGVEHRKNLHILTSQLRQVVKFSVGPFTTLTVATFIQIIKGAYSYYTLLSKSQMK
ncbi:unnamed protein product [Diatraea saccharalis]|uniref:Odorant receptor n=1 Tax=Diatraea saccharalis TaxID=40085 RepID=A0A9N9R9F3_9NEOP|nr:unnamed protein product [Diatraea saccharalis]